MTIEISKPELEKLVQEEILNGHFRNVDDLLTEALNALREKYQPPAAPIRPRENHFPAACPVAAIAPHRPEISFVAGKRLFPNHPCSRSQIDLAAVVLLTIQIEIRSCEWRIQKESDEISMGFWQPRPSRTG